METIDVIYKLVAVSGIIGSAAWACFHHLRKRTYKSRLELEVHGSFVGEGDPLYLKVKIWAKNMGLSRTDIDHKESGLIVSPYHSENRIEETCLIDPHDEAAYAVFENHGWIEANESIQDELLIVMPGVGKIGCKLQLRIISRKHEWNASDIVFVGGNSPNESTE